MGDGFSRGLRLLQQEQGIDVEAERNELEGGVKDTVALNLRRAVRHDPDARAKQYQTADRAPGPQPVDRAEYDSAELETRARLAGIDLDSLAKQSPSTLAAMRDQRVADLAYDDLETIHAMRQSAIELKPGLERWWMSLEQSTRSGFESDRANHLRWQEMVGVLDEKDRREMERLERQPKFDFGIASGNAALDYFLEAPNVMLESTLPSMVNIVKGKIVGGAVGAGVGFAGGASYGSVVPGGGTLAGGAAGFKLGRKLGSEIGGVVAVALPMQGALWRELGGIEGLDESERRWLAIAGGTVGAFLEKAGFESIVKHGVRDALGDQAFRQTFRQLARGMVLAGLAEGGTETLQALMESGVLLVGLGLAGEESIESFEHTVGEETFTGLKAVMLRTLEAFKMGTQGGGLAAGVTQATSLVVDEGRARMATQRQESIDRLFEKIGVSKLLQRDPDGARKVFQAQVDAGEAPPTVFVRAEAVREFFQSEADPDGETEAPSWDPLLERVPGLRERMQEASLTGADLEIPYAEYAAYVAPTALGEATRADIRFDPRQMTDSEAEAWVKDNEAEFGSLQDLVAVTGDAREVLDLVRGELERQLAKQYDPAKVEALSDLHMARIQTRAARSGRTVAQLVEEQGVFLVEPKTGKATPLGPGIRQRLSERRLRSDVADLRAGRQREQQGLPKRPIAEVLKTLGGVDPESRLAGDLQSAVPLRGPGSLPGLYRRGGITDADQIPANEFEVLRDNLGLGEDEDGGVSTDQLLDLLLRERQGDPVRTAEQSEAIGAAEQARGELEQAIEATGLSLEESTDEEIVAALLAESNEPDVETDVNEQFSGNRGSILLTPSLRDVVIRFFTANDGTTMLHEGGHLWLEQLRQDATQPNARVQLQRDWQTVKEWLGLKDDKAEIATAQHERFAKATEQWFMEGRAPSIELESGFARFARWMVQAYKSLRNKYFKDVELTDPIREVLDRLVATDQQIREAVQARGLEQTVLTEADGLSEEQAVALYEAVQEGRRESEAANLRMHQTRQRAKAREAWKANAAKVLAEVSQAVDDMPVMKLRQWITHSGKARDGQTFPPGVEGIKPQRMSKQGLVSVFGDEEILKLLPSGGFGYWQRDGGLHPDFFAEVFGFPNAQVMIQALVETDKRDTVIKRMFDETMQRRYGAFATSAELDDAVVEAAANDKQIRALQLEDDALSKRIGRRALPREIAKRVAKDIIAATPIERIRPERYRAAAHSEARAAIRAHANGDLAQMQVHRQRQMVDLALEAEARVARAKAVGIRNNALRMARPHAQKILGRAGDGTDVFQNQMNAFLGRFNFVSSLANVQAKQSLPDWVREWREKGAEVRVPDVMLTNGRQDWSTLTMSQLQAADDTIRNIYHVARAQLQDLEGSEHTLLETYVADMVADTEQRFDPPNRQEAKTAAERAKKEAGTALAALKRMEFLVDRLGPSWRRILWEPLQKAEAREFELNEQVTKPIADAYVALTKGKGAEYQTHRAYKNLSYNHFKDNNNAEGLWTKADLIAIALNLGNASNRAKLLGGYKWTFDQVMSVLDVALTDKDWDFVQLTWDQMHKLWPEIREQELRLSGVAPPEIQRLELRTRSGKVLKGGYHPVVYNLTLAGTEEAGLLQRTQDDLYTNAGQLQRAITGHSHTNERNEHAVGPLHLSLNVIPSHLRAVTHDLTHRETLLRMWKLVNDPRVKSALQGAVGVAETELFNPWIQDIAGQHDYDGTSVAQWNNFARKLRTHMTVFTLGGRLTTLMLQPLGNFNAMGLGKEEVGKAWKGYQFRALREQLKNPTRNYEFAVSKSTFMKNRLSQIDRDLREVLTDPTFTGDITSKPGRWAMNLIGTVQMSTVDVPVWMAAYEAAQFELGMGETEAVSFADAMVSKSQGAGAEKDQSALLRKEGLWKFLTLFHSYQNTVFNNLDESAKRGLTFDRVATQYALQLMVPALGTFFIHQLHQEAKQLFFGIDDPDEDESFLRAMLLSASGVPEAVGLIPGLRNMQSAVGEFFGVGRFFDPSTPDERVAEYARNMANAASNMVPGGAEADSDDAVSFVANGLRLAAVYYKIPADYLIGIGEKAAKK